MGEVKFDLHDSIRGLVEAERPCLVGPYHKRHFGIGSCGGTGRIVPFAALRVECEHCNGTGNDYQPVQPYGSERVDCYWCDGRGWTPEPDVRAACWEVGKVMAKVPGAIPSWTEEGCLRAAEAWVKWMKEEP